MLWPGHIYICDGLSSQLSQENVATVMADHYTVHAFEQQHTEHCQHLQLATADSGRSSGHVHADMESDPTNSAIQIEGSALLDLQELTVLGVAGWRIHLIPRAASTDGSGLAELAVTELHVCVWERNETLLKAAIREGERCQCAS